MPNVSLCEQENEVHYHEFEYTIMFDVYTNSDVDIIDSDTQEVLYTIDSTHYGPFNMKKNKTYIARLVNGQTTQTQRPYDWSFSSDDIVYGEVAINEYNLYEYNIGYETLRFVKGYDMIDYPQAYVNFELIDCYDPDIMLRDAISNNGINVINQKFRDYAIDNNKTNYIEFYYDNNVLKARIKNAQTNDIQREQPFKPFKPLKLLKPFINASIMGIIQNRIIPFFMPFYQTNSNCCISPSTSILFPKINGETIYVSPFLF